MDFGVVVPNNRIMPELYYQLQFISDDVLYHSEHQLRHPGGIFNVSWGRVIKSLNSFLDVYEKALDQFDTHKLQAVYLEKHHRLLKRQQEEALTDQERIRIKLIADIVDEKLRNATSLANDMQEQLLERYKDFLDSCMSFLDDTFHILKTLYPLSSVTRPQIFAHKWLEVADRATYQWYSDKLKVYRSRIAPIVNRIKHNHARLRFFQMNTTSGYILGYFVEAILNDGAIGSDTEIHPKYQGKNTCISFNRDVKQHFVGLYYVTDALASTIRRIIGVENLGQYSSGKNGESNEIIKVLKRISAIPCLFYPDEMEKLIPSVIMNNDNVEISMSKSTDLRPYIPLSCQSTYAGDGYSRIYQMPYW